MDKLRPYLLLLKKHHFWLLCLVVIGVSYWGWSAGAAHFSDQYAQDKRKIESKFTALRAIEGRPNHPNESFTVQAKKIHDELKERAFNAWTKLYEQQEPELVWINELSAHLADKPADAEVPERVRYTLTSDFANKYIPQLYDLLGVLQEENWLAPSRTELIARYTWTRTPTTTQLRYAQEDYWVYTALLKIIAATNEGATGLFNAPIKEIREIRIAQAANQPPESTIANITAQMRPAQTASVAIPSNNSTDQELTAGRYLDTAAPTEGAPAVAPSGQSKKIPIFMALTMREEKIPELLAACANSTLPVEVQQCRLLPASSAEGGGPMRGNGNILLELYGTIYLFSPPSRTALGLVDPNATGDPTAVPFDPATAP